FAWARGACRHGYAEVELVYFMTQARDHRGFTYSGRPCQHDKASAVICATHRRLLGKAETLQKGTALTIAQAAQTTGLSDLEVFHDLTSFDLANLGRASRRADTLVLPMISSVSAFSRTSFKVVSPRLRDAFNSARALRASAALARACLRCSSVSFGRATGFLRFIG